jgi:hypothetical protein
VEMLMKEKKQGETKFTTKIEVPCPWMLMFFIFLNLALFMIKLKVLLFFLYFIDNFIMYPWWPNLLAKSYELVVGVYFDGFFFCNEPFS